MINKTISFHKCTQTEPYSEDHKAKFEAYESKITLQEMEILQLKFVIDQYTKKARNYDKLKEANANLKKQLVDLATSDFDQEKNRNLVAAVRKIFSPSQLHMLERNKKRICYWQKREIKEALALRDCGIKAYRFLRNKGYPLPSELTLKIWARTLEINPKELSSDEEEMSLQSEEEIDCGDHDKAKCGNHDNNAVTDLTLDCDDEDVDIKPEPENEVVSDSVIENCVVEPEKETVVFECFDIDIKEEPDPDKEKLLLNSNPVMELSEIKGKIYVYFLLINSKLGSFL